MATRKPKLPVISEADIQLACGEYLQLDGWRMLRTDPVSDMAIAQVIRKRLADVALPSHIRSLVLEIIDRSIRGKGFGELGMADCLFMRWDRDPPWTGQGSTWFRAHAEVMWIEFKRKDGKAQPHQKTWHAAERARGALTLIAGEDFPATIEGFIDWYEKSDLNWRMRKR